MKTEPFKLILAIIAAPLLSGILTLIRIVPAPPYQGFAAILYLPLCMLGFPISILLGLRKKLLGGKLLAAMVLSIVFPFVLFILINPLWMPSGMSTCKQVNTAGIKVTYECVDASSDDSSYHPEFTVIGFDGWPLMRVVEK